MPLVFPNVSTLGINRETRSTNAGFQYGTFKRLTLAGTVNDLTNGFGISGIWTGQQGVLNTIANDRNYQDLFINGVSFGSGRIESMSFDPGIDVRTKGYQASILVYDSGNLFNLTGAYYGGIDTSNLSYVQDFSENYSFDKKLNGGYSYSHDANVQFTSGVGQLQAIPAAQAFARSLFTGANLGLAFYSGFTNKQGKRYFSESYNLIDNSCAFQERFDFDNNDGAYSAIHTRSIQLDERGVVTASEQGTIRGIENPNYQVALTAVATQLTGAYTRCSGAVTYYYPSGAILGSSPISQGRTINIFDNVIGYSVIFNNDPNNLNTYFWDYTQQIGQQNGVGTITENGTVAGRGVNVTTAFQAAQDGYSTVLASITTRTTALFTSTFGSSTNFLQSKQASYAPLQGQISYAQQFSNDPTLIANAGIRRKDVTVENNAALYSYNMVNILNVGEIAQDNHQSTVGSQTIAVRLEGDKTVGLAAFKVAAITETNTRLPVGNDRYLAECSYSYTPNENSMTLNTTWAYNRFASPTLFPPNG